MPRVLVVAVLAVMSATLALGGCVAALAGTGGAQTLLGATRTTGPQSVSPSAQALDAAAALACPGLGWSLLAAFDEVVAPSARDPEGAGGGGPAPVVAPLCAAGAGTSPALALQRMGLAPLEVTGVLVLANALQLDPALPGPAGRALLFASAQLGTPYLWGGTGVGGFDCSGLVQAAYRAGGISLPRVAQDQYDAGPPLVGPIEPGDLVFFGAGPSDVEHVGLFIGQGDMIDAPHTGAVIRIEGIDRADLVGVTAPAGNQ
jgi:hypothetical protein